MAWLIAMAHTLNPVHMHALGRVYLVASGLVLVTALLVGEPASGAAHDHGASAPAGGALAAEASDASDEAVFCAPTSEPAPAPSSTGGRVRGY
jgi:hypothetical protein